MANHAIRGQVISGETRGGLANVRVEAWDRDLHIDDLLGAATSDASGAFTIEFDRRYYRQIVARRPDIYFKVFVGGRLVADTRHQVLWNVVQPQVRVLITVRDSERAPADRLEPFAVEGVVATEEGRAVANVIIQAWDQGLDAETLLATGATDRAGRYILHYDREVLAGKSHPDLTVRALDPRRERTEIARSAVIYQAGPSVIVNLRIPAQDVSRPSEYERLLADTHALLGRTTLEALEADGVVYLASRSGWDARTVAMAAEATRLSAETRIPAPHYYALLRAGLPADSASVHQWPDESVRRTIETAIETGVIPADQPIDTTLRIYRERSVTALQELAPVAAVSKLGDMLDVSLDAGRKQRFLEVYRATSGEPAKLWPALEDAGFDRASIERLRTDGRLGFLTRQNAPLVARLRRIASVERAEDLPRAGLYKAEAWTELIGNDLPPQITADQYAAGLAAQVNLAYPTLVAAEMVRRREVAIDPPGAADEGEVAGFLRASHGRHTIGREPIKRWTGYEQLSAEGREGARLLERLYQMSPSNESMVALSTLGLNSAYQVTREPKEVFLQRHGGSFPSETEARLVYQKAQAVHTTALNLAAMYLSYRSAPNVYALTGERAKRKPDFTNVPGTPTLEDLLSNMDYCACDHCKSVFSPAAYFVDVLHMIDVATVPAGKKNPLDVLFARRPDLQNLLLSCENTNVALPYIDIVNEILEHWVVNGSLTSFLGHNMREDSKSADLLADPEFVEATAYDATKSEVYPHPLPFDMPLATLRLLMQAWDTTLAEALRIVGSPAAARRETLGLNGVEYRILTETGFKSLPEYFGEAANASIDALNTAVADGKTFCRRTSISYQDLVDLLKTTFVNPGAPLVPRLEALGVPLAQLQSWYDGVLNDAGLTALFPADVDPADYGHDILQWLRDNESLIMGLIVLTDVGPDSADCNFAKVELRFALPDATANRLTAIAYHKLLRIIRLRKKLGWSIDLTNRVVMAFLPVQPQQLAEGNIDAVFVALLARIANFIGLARRLSVPDRKLGDWLTVWDASQSTAIRQEKLAHLLRMGAVDLVHLSEITGIDPIANDMEADVPSLHRFLDAWGALKGAKLKVMDVAYVLRHQDASGKLAPTESALLSDLKSLRDALTDVDAGLSAPPETADLAYARSKMALVYDATVVDSFIGIVSGSQTYDVTFATSEETLPAKLMAADARIGLDPFREVLTYSGVMTAAARTALAAAADTLVLADMGAITTQADLDAFIAAFKAAVQTLANQGTADVQALAAEYPELQPVYTAVAAAPDAVAQTKVLIDAIIPALGGRLKAISARSTLASLLKIDRRLVDVLTEGPATVHASADATRGVLDDFLALETAVSFDANQAYVFHIDAPATDDYIFYAAAPAGTTVTIDLGGASVIPATVVGPSGEVAAPAAVRLQSGSLMTATLTLGSLPVSTHAELRWRTKAMAKTAVPTSRIYDGTRVAAARASLIRLQKAALLLRAMPLTPRELHHFAAIDADTGGYLNDLDTDGTIGPVSLHALWDKLAWIAWFTALKRDEPEEDTWVGLLEDPGKTTAQGALVFAGANNWREQDLNDTLTHLGTPIAAVTSLPLFRRVKQIVDFISGTSQPAADVLDWAVDAPDAALVAGIKQKLRARLDESSWRATLQSVNDALRNERRDALVAYILHHAPPSAAIDTADKLYEHFLIDVEMDACMKTSRIRQALSTVQLFVTRCLMNLEPEVAASSISASHWAWMKRYRVWEANRKIFIWPENWLEPELRDNKSPFFRELESDLLKSDITDELAEDAYFSYLKKLDEVARLEIVGCYLQEQKPGDQDDDILHVFGRTNGSTRQYYYRRYEYGYWTPWEKVTLNIQGDLVFPMMWKNQLFLFWLTAASKPEGADSSKTPRTLADDTWGASARIEVELHLSWGEYYKGKWTSPKSSELRRPMRLRNLATFEPTYFYVAGRTEKPGPNVSERLVMMIGYMGSPGHIFKLVFTSKNVSPIVTDTLDGSLLLSPALFNYVLLWSPQPNAVLDSNSLRRFGRVFNVSIVQPSGASKNILDQTLLTKTKLLSEDFGVRPAMHPVENQYEAPAFYSDEHSVFFMSPHERIESVLKYDGYFWSGMAGVFVPPEKVRIPPLYEQPVLPDPIGPVVKPLETFINPQYQRAISDDNVFVYRGTPFDARGIAKREMGR